MLPNTITSVKLNFMTMYYIHVMASVGTGNIQPPYKLSTSPTTHGIHTAMKV